MRRHLLLHFTFIISVIFMSFNSGAVVINRQAFSNNGGDLNNIVGTLDRAYQPLTTVSLQPQFAAVGKIYACTSTWLGDSRDGKNAYFLTAAHCVEHLTPDASAGRFFGEFRDRHHRVIARDGAYFLGPYRANPPAGFGGASTDIAILVLHKIADMKDDLGRNLAPPVLYDGAEETSKAVSFVGYGEWGTGNITVTDFNPAAGSMRAGGQSVVDGIREMGYAIIALYDANKSTKSWARLSRGDSGSAWWQLHRGVWTIVGVTNGGNASSSTASRVTEYISWIKGVYPEARTLADITTLTVSKELRLPDFSEETNNSSVAYTVPLQAEANGPRSVLWDSGSGYSKITLFLKNMNTSEVQPVTVRAWRNVGCGKAPMNTAVSCGEKQSALVLQYKSEDNPILPPGRFGGYFDIEATGWHDNHYHKILRIAADIDTLQVDTVKPLYPQYIPGYRYNSGTRVTARNGRHYQCKRFPFTHLCAGYSKFYEPGYGTHWRSAWIVVR